MPRPLSVLLLLFAATLPSLRADDGTVRLTVKDSKGAAVPDAVLTLVPLDQPAAPLAAPLPAVEIVQEDQEYIPYVTVLRAGTQVDFPNRDTIQHHLYSVSKPKRFEKPLYASGARESVVFDQPGVVTLGCNIHDWMIAYVVVVDTPHFTKTDAAGAGVIAGLPAGRYRAELWHPRLGKSVTQELTLAAGADLPLTQTLTLRPDRRIRRAPDGKAGGY